MQVSKSHGLSMNSYQLKLVALSTMIIDHVAFVFQNQMPHTLYLLMRGIGRISFPIYCFLLVEGFFHSRSRRNYLIRLSIFCILSELPFDLAFYYDTSQANHASFLDLMHFSHQNVFFTLTIGFLAICLLERYAGRQSIALLSIFLLPCLAEYLCFDYGSVGVMTILLFYYHRKIGRLPLWAGLVPLLLLAILGSQIELACIACLPFLLSYNGEKGKSGWKYLFYAAYPLHLLFLFCLKIFL